MKVVLTIAGSDSSGGAGVQADLKTFEAFGLFGTSAITVLTAQKTSGVVGIQEVDASFVAAQINAVLEDFNVAAIKIGMLYSKAIIEAVREVIQDLHIPIVLDPVFISKAGSTLLQEDAIESMRTLFPYAAVITPNLFEAEGLFGYRHGESDSLALLKELSTPVLIKNQLLEMPSGAVVVDQLYFAHQKRVFLSPYIETENLHGTGCSYSSAIAANLALGHTLERAIDIAKRFITVALIHAPAIGEGPGPINHKQGGLHIAIT